MNCHDHYQKTISSQAQKIELLSSVALAYADARIASNELGIAGMTAGDTIRMLGAELSQLKSRQSGVVLPERMVFSYKHKDGSQADVTVTRGEVLDKMGDHIYEELIGKFCQCQSAGETNVVECNCEDYAAGFKLVDGEVARLNSSAVSAGDDRGHDTKGSRKALGAMNAKLKSKVGRLERKLAALSAPSHSEQVKKAQGEAVAVVIAGEWGNQVCFLTNEKPSPSPGTKLYTAPPAIPATQVLVERELLERRAFEQEYLRVNYPRVHSGELSAPPIFRRAGKLRHHSQAEGDYEDSDIQRCWVMWWGRAILSSKGDV